jgi:hypothetical protein
MPSDRLQDMMCDLPGFLEDIDRYLAWPPDKPGREEFKAAYCQRVSATLEALYTRRWDWQQKFPDATTLISPNDLDPEVSMPLPPSPFQTIVWFTDPYRAAELMTYNAIRLIMTRSLEMAGIQVDTSSSSVATSDPLLPMQGSRHDVAVEICRMVDYNLHHLRRSSGAFMILFPLSVAYLNLDGDRDGAKSWLETVMSMIADSHGFEVGRRERRQLYSPSQSGQASSPSCKSAHAAPSA